MNYFIGVYIMQNTLVVLGKKVKNLDLREKKKWGTVKGRKLHKYGLKRHENCIFLS